MKGRECRPYRGGWLAPALAGTLLLICTAVVVHAQEPVNITINEIDSSDFPRLTAYATVFDATGHAILGLDEGAFTLMEDGMPIGNFAVEYQEDVDKPIVVTLVLDTSGSMKGQPLEDTQAAAIQLINDLGPADEVAVLSFHAVVTTHVGLTTDKGAAVAAVEALTAEGGTAFNDAVYEAVTMLARRPRGRKAVVVLTDGDDTDSVLTIDDGIDVAQGASIPVYAIGFGPAIQPNVLERLARRTGGHFYQSPSSEEVGESFGAVARLLRHQYVLYFDSSLQADGADHSLRVAVEVEGVERDDDAHFTAERREVTVQMVAPGAGERIGGLVNLVPRIEAPADVAQVKYLLDGAELGTVTTGDFSYDWDTAGVPMGEHTVTARATDSAGNEGQADVIVEVVDPVTITFITPPEEELEKLSGEVLVEVEVEALHGVARVEFAVDSEVVTTVESFPYQFMWNTAAVETGQHTLMATVYDVNNLSDQDTLEVWVEFRDPAYVVWVALGVLLLASGVILPLAVRKRRKMLLQPTSPVGPMAPPSPAVAVQPAREVTAPVAWLVVEQGPQTGQRWPVPLGETSLGRRRADNDIVVPSGTASRRHAVIRTDAENCVYYDLEPTNPTLINDAAIVGPHELTEGDHIRIGDVILRFTMQ